MNSKIINQRKRRIRSNVKYAAKENQLLLKLSGSEKILFDKYIEDLFSKDVLIGEKWMPIIGWSGYEISIIGRIRNLTTKKIKKPHLHHSGYYTCSLHKDGIPKYFILSRLISIHFVPNPNNFPEINHKNKIRRDNRISNLEWNLAIENSKHRNLDLDYDNKKPLIQKTLSGEFIKNWESAYAAGKALGKTASNIISTVKGRYNHAYGFRWEYKNINNNVA